MGLLDKIFGSDTSRHTDDGRGRDTGATPGVDRRTAGPGQDASGRDPDEVAVERYRYMLRTAPPETVEQAHAEAFAKLTPEQRRHVLSELSASAPQTERSSSDDPASLARMATRAEMREPGTMERTLGGGRGGGMGMGGMLAGSLLASVAGAFIGTSIAGAFLDDDMAGGGETASGEEAVGDDEVAADDAGTGDIGEAGISDPGMGDLGGDFGI